jgi:hypothetical protein
LCRLTILISTLTELLELNFFINVVIFLLSFREHAKKLMLENDQLQSNMVQNEQESIEIFTLLQHNEEKKNNQVR